MEANRGLVGRISLYLSVHNEWTLLSKLPGKALSYFNQRTAVSDLDRRPRPINHRIAGQTSLGGPMNCQVTDLQSRLIINTQ